MITKLFSDNETLKGSVATLRNFIVLHETIENGHMIYETSKNFTELWERFVEVLRNHLPPTELKKVANKNHETFWDPPNLKSFGGEVANFQSSGKDLFFLECTPK